MSGTAIDADYLIIGGGFYGCCLALFLRSISDKVVLVEAEPAPLTRASRVNQARVHTGFHYPRSFVTAVKSKVLHTRFVADFPEAVVDDFRMLYAIARRRSKVSAGRFHRMFAGMDAPIRPADQREAGLFDPDTIEAVFECREYAFDWSRLQAALLDRLDRHGVRTLYGQPIAALSEQGEGVTAELADGSVIRAARAFNVTYAHINELLDLAGLPPAPLKFELAELALVQPPPSLDGLGVTVMDGPFFSTMPYPAEGLYSLTHVRYTPQLSWSGRSHIDPAQRLREGEARESRVRHMLLDSARYLPSIREARWERSIYDIKTVLLKNERDDGRPILFHRHPATSRITSIMGGKIDNIYDLFDLMRMTEPECRDAHDDYVCGRA